MSKQYNPEAYIMSHIKDIIEYTLVATHERYNKELDDFEAVLGVTVEAFNLAIEKRKEAAE